MKVFSPNEAKKRRTQRSDSADFTSLPNRSSCEGLGSTSPTPKIQTEDADGNRLPVADFAEEIVRSVMQNPDNKVLLVQAETGSGKSTLIPSFFLTHKSVSMVVTQPRRVAAITLAHRVASQQSMVLGQRIGYRVRFDDRTSGSSQLIYATDGMLLREAMADPLLYDYSIVFLDEAHERSLQTDILMGVVHRARRNRPKDTPLRVVVMSATLHIDTFRSFFGKDSTHVIQIPGRQFPVDILYTEIPPDDYADAALSTIVQIHEHNPPASGDDKTILEGKMPASQGDILVFLPGQEEIEDLAIMLKQYLISIDEDEASKESSQLWTGDRVETIKSNCDSSANRLVAGVLICVLYAALPPEAQLEVFAERPAGCSRKVILATNIAETSITLPNVKYVIDTGKYKSRQASSTTGMESLTVQDVSQAQAAQRSGRAGRVQPGLCFRLFTESLYDTLPPVSTPEILRVNLSQVVLQLKGMGVDPTTFEFVTPPDKKALIRATKVLFALSALNEEMDLTACGKKLAKLPLDPIFGNLLLQSAPYQCTKEMLTAVSLLSSDNLFYRPSGEGGLASKAADAHRRFLSHEGDLPTYLNVYHAWQREAVYVPPSQGGRKAQKRQRKRLKEIQKQKGGTVQLHSEWCRQNFVSARALARSFDIRAQLERIAGQDLGMQVETTFGDDWERFYKCVAAGLFLQAASRARQDTIAKDNRRSGLVASSVRGRYQTKVGNTLVSIHPTSSLFGRNPAPKCIVYTELVTTKKTYIRGVTQIREEWLQEVAPKFYSSQG